MNTLQKNNENVMKNNNEVDVGKDKEESSRLRAELKRVLADIVSKDVEIERLKHFQARSQTLNLNSFSSPAQKSGAGVSRTNDNNNNNNNRKNINSNTSTAGYENCIKGILDALLDGHFIISDTALSINTLAQKSNQDQATHSVRSSMEAQEILARALDTYKLDYQSALQVSLRFRGAEEEL